MPVNGRVRLLALLLFLGGLATPLGPTACRNGSSSGDGDVAAEGGGAENSAGVSELDVLRALPYLGYSAEKAEEGKEGAFNHDPARSYPGYNLYGNARLCSAELIDQEGEVVRSWQMSPCLHWGKFELLPNGDFIVVAMDLTDKKDRNEFLSTRSLLRFSWEGELIWQLRLPVHHDVEITPGDQILAMTMKYRRLPAIHPEIDVRDHFLTLLSHQGEVLSELSLYDTLSESPDYVFEKLKVKKRGLGEIDLLHSNSVAWMRHKDLEKTHPIYAPENVLVSIRNQDVIVVIDWEGRKLIWSWGQGEISGPHDALVLENGNFLLFDNGLERGWSRVIELDPLRKEIVWQYSAEEPTDFFTRSRGTNQRLPNGNTLITDSDSGRSFELTPEKETVWEFYNPHLNEDGHRATVAQLTRYEASFIDSIRKERKAGPTGVTERSRVP